MKGNYNRLTEYFQDAVKALNICGVLSDSELEEMKMEGGRANRNKVVTFHINENLFREKDEPFQLEDKDENNLILTPEV